MQTINVSKFARHLAGYQQCKPDYKQPHKDAIMNMCEHLPHGSGLDCGVIFNFDESTPDKLVFMADFHHINDSGYYDGWSKHKVIITPSLQYGLSLRITGLDRNYIKDYLHELFSVVFSFDPSEPTFEPVTSQE
jgi:hypothetical protein